MSQTESQLMAPLQIDFSNTSDDEARHCIPVYLRVKPSQDEEMSIKIIDDTTVETNHALRTNKKATYTRVFPGSVTQQEVFEGTSAPLIRRFLNGANVMTFAYGVTSSGKTYTIMGSQADPGILPRTLELIFGSCKSKIDDTIPIYKPTKFDEVEEIADEDIDLLEDLKATLISKVKASQKSFDQYSFDSAASDSSSLEMTRFSDSRLSGMASCCVWISIYDIHNEVITDLLGGPSRSKGKALSIGQDLKGRTFVKDLIQVPVHSAAEAYALLQYARQNLAIAKTKLNDASSRSHMVFNLRMIQWDDPMEPFVNQFVISDLAGSERQAKTGTSGLTLKQAGAINNSLLVLGRCLEALRKKDKGIAAPFRDSKLTRMLNPFFTQGGYVSLIICINPSVTLQDETMDTVRFSAIASEIVQDIVRPLERLRQLRRLTLTCMENSPRKVAYNADIERWQDAVIGTNVQNGVTYVEVQASYFNAMARDILRAEKLLTANEAEIESLNNRLKESEASKENVRNMYVDKMKEQREKLLAQRAELEEAHRDLQRSLVEDFEEEIGLYKEKYSKYRDGYAKVSDYLKDRLWPEMYLFRERFGYLPEFPPKEGIAEEETKPENTIKYWQDKLQNMEADNLSLKSRINRKNEQIANLQKEVVEQKKKVKAVEAVCQECLDQSSMLARQVDEYKAHIAAVEAEGEEREMLFDEINDLKQALQQAEENRESLVAEYQIQIHSLKAELLSLQAERCEKKSQVRSESVTQSARPVRTRHVVDGSLKTPARQRTTPSATRLSPCASTKKTPRRRIATVNE